MLCTSSCCWYALHWGYRQRTAKIWRDKAQKVIQVVLNQRRRIRARSELATSWFPCVKPAVKSPRKPIHALVIRQAPVTSLVDFNYCCCTIFTILTYLFKLFVRSMFQSGGTADTPPLKYDFKSSQTCGTFIKLKFSTTNRSPFSTRLSSLLDTRTQT